MKGSRTERGSINLQGTGSADENRTKHPSEDLDAGTSAVKHTVTLNHCFDNSFRLTSQSCSIPEASLFKGIVRLPIGLQSRHRFWGLSHRFISPYRLSVLFNLYDTNKTGRRHFGRQHELEVVVAVRRERIAADIGVRNLFYWLFIGITATV